MLINGAECGGPIHIGTGENRGNDISNHNQGIAVNGDCVSVVQNRVNAFRPVLQAQHDDAAAKGHTDRQQVFLELLNHVDGQAVS